MSSGTKTIRIVAGPTASGKSARALELAGAENGVVINCDSMQLYDGLPILTAQPSEEDKAKAPHLLYGALHPGDMCSAGDWCKLVRPLIEKTLQEGRTPIIVGGTGLYIKALMEGLSPIPEIPEEIRQAAEALQRELGNPAFHAALGKRDPVMAQRLHPSNTQRLVRAWEVLEHTGRSLAEWQSLDKVAPPAHWNFEVEIIMPEREELYRRCDARFLKMMDMGVLDEVKDFSGKLESGEIPADAPLTKALGFTHLRRYLAGDITQGEAIALSQLDTRRYAKRQVTWFRNQL
ncbi:MAG TPA: tRNA (adenosine(37)-N6)-dimethylallyltransferase MiaA [Rhodospirillaceae bacterium]|nr:tRNA (adenosine(37)-N6)-dimethylallyltransferase MiaA [Rhodospirillaceae bacterium]